MLKSWLIIPLFPVGILLGWGEEQMLICCVNLSEDAEEISHSPESGVESKARFVIGGNRPMTTKDRVFNKMFNN